MASRKPFLTERMRKKRISWCKEYAEKTEEFWNRVFFADETYIHVNMTGAMNRIRRYSSESRLSPRFTSSTVKYPLKILIWGCFSSSGIGRLYISKQTMNSERYLRTLENFLLPSFRDSEITEPLFLDDSAPCHRSVKVQNFKNQKSIETLKWPGNSPDLNPIENVWSLLKRKVARIPNTTERSLIENIIKVWNYGISKDYLQNLAKSMPKRIKEVLKAKGYPTKY